VILLRRKSDPGWLNNRDVHHRFLVTLVFDRRFPLTYTIFRILNIGIEYEHL